MQLPCIHLNGSDAKTLAQGYFAVYDVLRTAETAIRETAPHGRDYYPISGDAASIAMAEHLERLDKIRGLMADYLALARHCQKALDKRD